MEWQGINLSGKNQSDWRKKAALAMKQFVLVLFFTMFISAGVVYLHLQKNQQIRPLVEQLSQVEQSIQQVEQKLTFLQSDENIALPFVNAEKLSFILTLIHSLPLKNGGLETLQLYFENGLLLKINGKCSTADFQLLEKYLTEERNTSVKTDKVKMNNKNEMEFTFLIQFKG